MVVIAENDSSSFYIACLIIVKPDSPDEFVEQLGGHGEDVLEVEAWRGAGGMGGSSVWSRFMARALMVSLVWEESMRAMRVW